MNDGPRLTFTLRNDTGVTLTLLPQKLQGLLITPTFQKVCQLGLQLITSFPCHRIEFLCRKDHSRAVATACLFYDRDQIFSYLIGYVISVIAHSLKVLASLFTIRGTPFRMDRNTAFTIKLSTYLTGVDLSRERYVSTVPLFTGCPGLARHGEASREDGCRGSLRNAKKIPRKMRANASRRNRLRLYPIVSKIREVMKSKAQTGERLGRVFLYVTKRSPVWNAALRACRIQAS